MTHSEIYPKFMIEYDKANVTSSYPSLTKYEIATILDKAYLALIAQKLTGNNYRQVSFERDIKNLEDLRPLVTLETLNENTTATKMASNDAVFDIPAESLYYVKSDFVTTQYPAIDEASHIITPVMLISHEDASLFMNSTYNVPWIKNPVAVMQDNYIHILYDAYENNGLISPLLNYTYIKYPAKFVSGDESTTFDDAPTTEFELSDSMAEELINLAIIMAAEEVEAQRLTTKLNQRALES